MKFLIKILMILALTPMVLCAETSKSIKLQAFIKNNNISYSIKNISKSSLKISKKISLDPLYSSIEFEIKYHGMIVSLVTSVNPNLPDANSYEIILPGGYARGSIDLNQVEGAYGISNGCYRVVIIYNDRFSSEFHALSETARSGSMSVCKSK